MDQNRNTVERLHEIEERLKVVLEELDPSELGERRGQYVQRSIEEAIGSTGDAIAAIERGTEKSPGETPGPR